METLTLDRPLDHFRPAARSEAAPAAARTQTPAPPRLDLYESIHKALRAEMAGVLTALGALDTMDAEECATTLARTEALLHLVGQHLVHEERFVHPVLEAALPGSSAGTEFEHAEHREAIAVLRADIAALRQAPQPTAALHLYRQYALFVAENLVHMQHEETVLNARLWAACSDAELMDVHQRLLASIPPAEMGQVLPIMLPALCPQQRAGMLAGMQAELPPEAMRDVVAMARAVLDGRGWAKLTRALNLPAG